MSAPELVYKVLTGPEMEAFERDGRFEGSEADRRDGFIHLSTCDQLTETVDKHFAGQHDLHVAAVDLSAYRPESVKWEESRGGQLFPHLYEPMLLDTITAYNLLQRNADGTVRLPVAG